MIKAYHMVGSDEWSEEELSDGLHEILSVGEIQPAIARLDPSVMEHECFSERSGYSIRDNFERATKKSLQALEEIAESKISKLPDTGFTKSLFNCLDLIVGDLEYVFLSLGNWYSVPNGFVFDAKQLVMEGAKLRPTDLLGDYKRALEIVVNQRYKTVKEAKAEIRAMIDLVQADRQYSGKGAVEVLDIWSKRKGGFSGGSHLNPEVVVKGALPIAWAVEVWENGKKIKG